MLVGKQLCGAFLPPSDLKFGREQVLYLCYGLLYTCTPHTLYSVVAHLLFYIQCDFVPHVSLHHCNVFPFFRPLKASCAKAYTQASLKIQDPGHWNSLSMT